MLVDANGFDLLAASNPVGSDMTRTSHPVNAILVRACYPYRALRASARLGHLIIINNYNG